ncbi:unnamed protein product, partial [Musa acuminata var. zebrina]
MAGGLMRVHLDGVKMRTCREAPTAMHKYSISNTQSSPPPDTGSHRLSDGDRPCLMVSLRHPPNAHVGSTGELIPTVPSSSSRAMTRSAHSYRKAKGAGAGARAAPAITRLGVDISRWWACHLQLFVHSSGHVPTTSLSYSSSGTLSLSLSLLTLITFSSWTSAGVRTAAMRRLGGLALMTDGAGFGATCAVDVRC